MKKTLSIFLAFLMLFLSFSFAHAETSDEQSETITFEDVLAGVATLEEYNATHTKGDIIGDPGSSSGLANATYYFNNKLTGGFLKTNLTTQSGLLANLGNSIKWRVTKSGDYYTIRMDSNSTKFLGVPSANKASNEVVLVTVNGTVPAHCRWTAYIDASGGCHLKSAFNYKYLYANGSSIAMSSSLGSGDEKDKRVWRAMTTSYYGNTASSTKRELSENSSIRNIEVVVGGSGFVVVNKGYSNELFTLADDFTYSLSNTKAVYSNGKVIGNSGAYGGTKITATHKVTGRKKTFYVLLGFSSTINVTPLAQHIIDGLNEPHDVKVAGSESRYYKKSEAVRRAGIANTLDLINRVRVGALIIYPNAGNMLSQYLLNMKGCREHINFERVINEWDTAKTLRNRDMNRLISAVEASATSQNQSIKTIAAFGCNTDSSSFCDWKLAIGSYTTCISCTYKKVGNTYTAYVFYELHDVYDWSPSEKKIPKIGIEEWDMWELHHGGEACNFEIDGNCAFTLTWTKGQTMENGVIISNGN
ncbi:MAG: RICIN domain-containing protein [Clostridia bacterium]|nr:RICIN domain-containing protein [Clostridia bacterium]